MCRIQFALKQGKDVEYIKAVVNRALLSLPQRKRIKFLSQTAILEFKCGVPDEGRSRFELILREYPKRTDLWSVYLDQVRTSYIKRVNCSVLNHASSFTYNDIL